MAQVVEAAITRAYTCSTFLCYPNQWRTDVELQSAAKKYLVSQRAFIHSSHVFLGSKCRVPIPILLTDTSFHWLRSIIEEPEETSEITSPLNDEANESTNEEPHKRSL